MLESFSFSMEKGKKCSHEWCNTC